VAGYTDSIYQLLFHLCVSSIHSIYRILENLIPKTDINGPPSQPTTKTTKSPSVKSKTRSKKSTKSNSFLSLLLCCSLGVGSLLDDKDGSRGSHGSASEPQSERVLDRNTNQGDVVTSISDGGSTTPQSTSHRDDLTTIVSYETGGASSSLDTPIALQDMAVNVSFSKKN
jgi:hypothetical protein